MASPATALIIDDDAFFVTVAADCLRSRGMTVLTATTGQDARELARRPIDVALVDMFLPDDDGASLCRDIRALAPEAAIVLVTARPEGLSLVERGQVLADDVFIKSNDLAELAWRVSARSDAARALSESRRREHFLRGVVRLADVVSPHNDLPTLAATLAPALLTLPGVEGARVELAADAVGDLPITVLEAGQLPVSGDPTVIEVPLRAAAAGRLLLATRRGLLVDSEVRETLGALVGAAVSSARQFQALKDRQLRLERGYVGRHRKLSRVSARLERLSEARDSFLALLSHDLRSPLAVILGQAQLLEEGLIAPGQHGKVAATVRRQGERMVQMVEDLLDRYRRDDAVRAVADSGDAVRLAHDMADHMRPLAQGRRQQIDVLATGEAPIEVDIAAIREVLANLLENSLRHSPEGATVRVELSVADGRVQIAIRDEGPGFAGRAAEGGSGAKIGLRAAARIVADAGGSLRTSAIPGGGGLAVITLPLAIPRVAATTVEVYAADVDLRATVSELLSRHWEVRGHDSLSGALDRMRRDPPAVVVLDDRVSPESVAWVRQLKADADLASVPLVVFTDEVHEMHDAGALAALHRPVDGPRLVGHVRRALRLLGDLGAQPGGSGADMLTGLPNGRALTVRLDESLSRARAEGWPLPVVLLRVDDLREVNRQHGWLVGDQLLLWLADRLRDRVCDGEIAARVDAETFALALPHRGLEEAQALATELREGITRARPRLGVARVDVRVSAQALDLATLALGDQSLVGAVRGGEA